MTDLEETRELLTDIVKESGITEMITDMKLGSEKYDEYIKYVSYESLEKLDRIIDEDMGEIREYLNKKDNKIYNAMMYIYLFSRFYNDYDDSGAMSIGGEECEYGERYDDVENEAIFDFFSRKLKDYKDGDEIVIDYMQINLHEGIYFIEYEDDELREYLGLGKDEYIRCDDRYVFIQDRHTKTERPKINDFVDHVCKYYDVKIKINEFVFCRVG